MQALPPEVCSAAAQACAAQLPAVVGQPSALRAPWGILTTATILGACWAATHIASDVAGMIVRRTAARLPHHRQVALHLLTTQALQLVICVGVLWHDLRVYRPWEIRLFSLSLQGSYRWVASLVAICLSLVAPLHYFQSILLPLLFREPS